MTSLHTAASLASLSLTDLKRLVYTLANQAMGTRISQTKQLKRYTPSKDLRVRANWVALALQFQARVIKKAELTAAAIAS